MKVLIANNALNLDDWSVHETDDLIEFIIDTFIDFPDTARIYHQKVSQDHDVTPQCEADIAKLGDLDGTFYIVVYPAGIEVIIAVVVSVVAVAAVAFLLQPDIPTPTVRMPNQGNRQDRSPNNELAERTNRPRIGGRIPDIFGQVHSTPDLIAYPYRVFENHKEIEIAFMCVGRGSYAISQIKDGSTLVSEIAGTAVEIYEPYKSPNKNDDVQLRIGSAIPEDVVKITTVSGVNGQTLRPSNSNTLVGANNIRFTAPDAIEGIGVDFTDYFESGDLITVTNALPATLSSSTTTEVAASDWGYEGGVLFSNDGTMELDNTRMPDVRATLSVGDGFVIYEGMTDEGVNTAGTYRIKSIHATENSFKVENNSWNFPTNPSYTNVSMQQNTKLEATTSDATWDFNKTYTAVGVSSGQIALSNPNWTFTGSTAYQSPTLSTSGDKWIGQFAINVNDVSKVYANFVAPNGLYKDDGKVQTRTDVVVQLEVEYLNSGNKQQFNGTIEGSATIRDQRAVTIFANLSETGAVKVRARRITDTDTVFEGTVVDDIKWHSVYGVSEVGAIDFGNVTTAYTKTHATTGALAIKERKLNMVAYRKIPLRTRSTLTATNNAAEIISFICADEYIGNRTDDEIDKDSIYGADAEVISYFNNTTATAFSYTFDNNNLSFEETIKIIADAIFCVAYRQGNKIKLKPEIGTATSTLIFNHRNKIPNSETRSVSFGNADDHDGVQLDYVSPYDDVIESIYIPADRSALNPRSVETLGIRTEEQAYWHAWRTWNKIRYQNTTVEFSATQEAAASVISDRVLVADNTRPDTQDGEVLGQSGLGLSLSQPVTWEDGSDYIISLQHIDGTIENIPINRGSTDHTVILSKAPRLALSVDPEYYAKATYVITKDDHSTPTSFLLSDKSARDTFTYELTVVNYDPLYYQNDNTVLFEEDEIQTGDAKAGASTGLANTAAYTMMGWIQGSALIFYNANESLSFVGGKAGAGVGSVTLQSSAVSDSVYNHVAYTYDSDSTLTLYLNGAQVNQQASVVNNSRQNLTRLQSFTGKARDLRILNRAITAEEINSIYRSTKGA